MLGGGDGGRNFAGVMAGGEEHGAKEQDNADLDERGPVLKVRTFARAPNIYSGDDQGHYDGGDRLSCGRNREHFCEVFAESARECSDGAAGNHEKQAPTIEESACAAKPITNVTVQAAGFGIGSGEFGVGERAEQGENTSDSPYEEREANGAFDLAKNRAGRSKDAGADDGADEEKQKITESECANEFGHFVTAAARDAGRRKAS